MNFRLWLEATLYEDEDVIIRDATPDEIPEFFMHRTEDQSDIDGIVAHGFDMKKFGRTARRFKSPAFLTQYDAKGIYSNASDNNPNTDYQQYNQRPYVIFTAQIQRAIILKEKTTWANVKQALSQFMGNKTKTPLSRSLLKMGYQAILRSGSECIILDPRLITVVRSSKG